MSETDQAHKAHKARQSGRKAEKKQLKNEGKDTKDKPKNPKAFAVKSYVKALNTHTRTQDLQTKKLHVPTVDRTPILPPPTIVAIVGGGKSGKSTLLQGFVKNFTNRRMTNLVGPISIIAGRKNRFTFLEVNQDINCMIDTAKVADIALLLIDATVGIEFEIFEFLEICKAHGSPRIMGVMNHLDGLKLNNALKKEKKALKHRFQSELYPGAKVFFLTGMVHDAYKKNEISNLARFLSVMKYRPLAFRSSHPYVLVDRWEDITNQNDIRLNAKCDRSLVMYGYVRGSSFFPGSTVHIPGCGDFTVQSIDQLDDPCPYPHLMKKRSLNSKERLVYAPFAGVAGIIFDKDAVYIDLGGSHYDKRRAKGKRTSEEIQEDEEEAALLEPLLKLKKTAEEKVDDMAFKLFPDSVPLKKLSESEDEGDDEAAEVEKKANKLAVVCKTVVDANGNTRRVAVFQNESSQPESNDSSDDDSENDDDDDVELSDDKGDSEEESDEGIGEDMDEGEYRTQMFLKAQMSFYKNQTCALQISKRLYDDDYEENYEASEDLGATQVGNLFKKTGLLKKGILREQDCQEMPVSLADKIIKELLPDVRNAFATGEWSEHESAEKLLKLNDEAELYGDFEDLEAGTEFKADEPEEVPGVKKEKIKKSERAAEEKRLEKKRKLKQMFDDDYDGKSTGDHFDTLKEETSQQGQLNKSEFENMEKAARVKVEGYRPGLYVRIEFHQMPCEFVDNFDPTYPVIVGGLLDNEENYRIVRTRLKVHRYYHKILKNRDPLIFSLGWRRLQTMAYFAKREDDFRLRSLKYAKKYLHVEAFFWGPSGHPNSGFVAYQNLGGTNQTTGFRIAANGVVLEVDENDRISKKLKLIGYPLKIMGKSVYVKDMFHNDTEVAKFIGCKVQTQSTIRGIVKKASNVSGNYRAKFEDRIQMSDIIILKTWVDIEIQKFSTCVRTLLLPVNEKNNWQGMRTVAALKRDANIKTVVNPDNLYTPITNRREHISLPLLIPNKLQAALPYKFKEKIKPSVKEPERVIVVKDPEEVKMDEFIQKLAVVMRDKLKKESAKKTIRNKKYKKAVQAKDILREKHDRKTKKEMCRIISKRRRN